MSARVEFVDVERQGAILAMLRGTLPIEAGNRVVIGNPTEGFSTWVAHSVAWRVDNNDPRDADVLQRITCSLVSHERPAVAP